MKGMTPFMKASKATFMTEVQRVNSQQRDLDFSRESYQDHDKSIRKSSSSNYISKMDEANKYSLI